jgi:hypothetical protein
MGIVKREIAPQRKKRESWSEEKVAVICKEIAAGKTYEQAFTRARVAKSAFYARLKSDMDFMDAVKNAEAEFAEYFDSNIVQTCKRSLCELITGYEYDEVTTKTYPRPGNPKVTITEKKVAHKRVAPNVTALIFTLCNRDPEHWQNRVTQDVNGKMEVENKGSGVSLANVPDDLLAKVIDAINGK